MVATIVIECDDTMTRDELMKLVRELPGVNGVSVYQKSAPKDNDQKA